MSDVKILYVDTNAFLQLRDLKDIPWTEIFPAAARVDLMVASPVVEELDRFKNGTSDRRRNRARSALALIDEASSNEGCARVLREKPVEVRLVVSTAPRFDWSQSPILDPGKPDDQLVAEALSFGNGAAIFSCDTGPRIRARVVGLRAYEPNEAWYLQDEPTDEQKTIAALRRDLERARATKPTIIARFLHQDEGGDIRLIKPILPALDQETVKRLSDAYLARHPRKNASDIRRLSDGSPFAFEEYSADYSQFQGRVQDYFGSLHQKVGIAGLAVALWYELKNDSSVAAEGLRVEFEIDANGTLLAERDDARSFLGSIAPPRPPDRSYLSSTHLLSNFRTLDDVLADQRRDPVKFYWEDRPSLKSKHCSLHCEMFHAKRERTRPIYVFSRELKQSLEVHLRVGAANLPDPLTVSGRIVVSDQDAAWTDELVQEILPEELRGKV